MATHGVLYVTVIVLLYEAKAQKVRTSCIFISVTGTLVGLDMTGERVVVNEHLTFPELVVHNVVHAWRQRVVQGVGMRQSSSLTNGSQRV